MRTGWPSPARNNWCGLQPRHGKDPNVTGVPDFCLQTVKGTFLRHCTSTGHPLFSNGTGKQFTAHYGARTSIRSYNSSTITASLQRWLLTYRETLPSPPTIHATSSVPPTPSFAPLVAARIPPPDYSGRSTKHCANRPVFFATNM